MTPEQSYELILLALCNWREARGQIWDAKRGQAWSVRNRVLNPTWWGTDWVSVITKPFQYSSFNANDPNAVKWPLATDTAWEACLAAATEAYAGTGDDPVSRATHYFDRSLDNDPPSWARDASMVHVLNLGDFRFWRPARF